MRPSSYIYLIDNSQITLGQHFADDVTGSIGRRYGGCHYFNYYRGLRHYAHQKVLVAVGTIYT